MNQPPPASGNGKVSAAGDGRGEFERIARHFAPLATSPAALALRDDAALMPASDIGTDLVMTADGLVAGVHFLADDPPETVGRKALRVNLSDLAAMGAAPLGYLLTAILPRSVDDAWLSALTRGLALDQRRFSVSLLGGDTVATDGPLTLAVTAIGRSLPPGPLRRSGARDGDVVAVSGWIGDGALGLAVATGRARPEATADPASGQASDWAAWLLDRYRLPRPRLALGRRLVGCASAAIDLSDGLAADLGHVAAASGVAIEIEWERLPISDAARAAAADQETLVQAVLAGGDDYELAVCLPPEGWAQAQAAAAAAGVPLTRIGRVMAGNTDVRVLDGRGTVMAQPRAGWDHFLDNRGPVSPNGNETAAGT